MRLTILGKGPAPRLERVKRLRDGRVLLGGTGQQEATKLEYPTDLKTWHPLANLLGGFNGDSAVWLDASATNAPTRFYRAVARQMTRLSGEQRSPRLLVVCLKPGSLRPWKSFLA